MKRETLHRLIDAVDALQNEVAQLRGTPRVRTENVDMHGKGIDLRGERVAMKRQGKP